MFGKKKNRSQKEIVSYVYRQPQNHSDERLRQIYLRYHYNMPIFLDDLYYLWKKDPESCEKFLRSYIGPPKDVIRMEKEQKAIVYIHNIEDELLRSKEHFDRTVAELPGIKTIVEVMKSMENVQKMIHTMNEHELNDFVNHLNTASELREQCDDELEGWIQFLNETTVYDTVIYDTTKTENEIDVSI